jgi:DNA-binding XRE family transcriptional regulator
MGERGKPGRRPHEPSEATRKQARALAAYGVPQDEIGKVIGVSKPTLEKHYREELDRAALEANAKVAESLFRKATGEGAQAVTAAIFWLKTRASWKEPPTDTNMRLSADGSVGGLMARIAANGRKLHDPG